MHIDPIMHRHLLILCLFFQQISSLHQCLTNVIIFFKERRFQNSIFPIYLHTILSTILIPCQPIQKHFLIINNFSLILLYFPEWHHHVQLIRFPTDIFQLILLVPEFILLNVYSFLLKFLFRLQHFPLQLKIIQISF